MLHDLIMTAPDQDSDEALPHKPGSVDGRVARLTAGQLEVLRLVNQHLNSKEIGALLGISPHTVDQRIRQAIRTLEVSRRAEAARLVAEAEGTGAYQRLISQPPYIDRQPESPETDGAAGFQIRHAGCTEGTGGFGLETEQGTDSTRSLSLQVPWSTRSNASNRLGVGQRLLWIGLIAIGSSFSAGMYLAGLESLARLVKG